MVRRAGVYQNMGELQVGWQDHPLAKHVQHICFLQDLHCTGELATTAERAAYFFARDVTGSDRNGTQPRFCPSFGRSCTASNRRSRHTCWSKCGKHPCTRRRS